MRNLRANSSSTRIQNASRVPSGRTRQSRLGPSPNVSSSTRVEPSDVSTSTNSNSYDHGIVDEGSNIRVVARCRGRNDREIKAKSNVVVDVQSQTEVSVRVGEDLSNQKTYSLDRVFGSESDQSILFDEVVSPIVDELLTGMNCTVFAYGQTGTGKT
jgi:kinesin family protein 11